MKRGSELMHKSCFSRKKRAQGSLEFVVISSVMFLVLTGLVTVIEGRMTGAYKERIYNRMEGLGNLIDTEIRLANSVQGDYSREFFLPPVIEGYNYTVGLINKKEVVIEVEGMEYYIFLDNNISGDIDKGTNTIAKQEDNISITPTSSILCKYGYGSDDDGCGVISCFGWYSKQGVESPTTTQYCYTKKDIIDYRCEGYNDCKEADDCHAQTQGATEYVCGQCQYIPVGECSGTTRGECHNFSLGTPCNIDGTSVCDGYGNCNSACNGNLICEPNQGESAENCADCAGPVLKMTFNNQDASDETMYSNDGTMMHFRNNGVLINAPQRTAGKVGGALSFDGTDDYVKVDDNVNDLDITNNITIEAWVKTGVSSTDELGIVSKYEGPTDMSYALFYSYLGDIQYQDKVYLRLCDSAVCPMNYKVHSFSKINNGFWHHVAGVYNGTHMSIFVDGVREATYAYNFGICAGNAKLRIGCHYYSGAETGYFNGEIDEVRIYDRALSGAEIDHNYKLGFMNNKPSDITERLVGYWNFDEPSGNLLAYDNHMWHPGVDQYALDFDGNDYVRVNHPPPTTDALDVSAENEITISAWIKLDSYPGHNKEYSIITDGNKSSSHIFLRITNDYDVLYLETGWGNGATDYSTRLGINQGELSLNDWHQVTGTFDGTQWTLYIDGAQINTNPVSTTLPSITEPSQLIIGAALESATVMDHFKGTIDEVLIFNRSLSQPEIANLYNFHAGTMT
ncbi:hypothetical protein AYK26_07810 [Euryarchaeota archaeon SM23-78]|nr:MAG: hypothetical protein AYK26_07810 [Euryarchaeota archaeon SM23-78]